MNLGLRELSYEELAIATAVIEDRRVHDRLKVIKTIHISSLDSARTQETAMVVDISREGMYFTVRSDHYCIGMEMRVTIPSLGFEGLCRVVRMEDLPGGFFGIGCLVLGW
jgi:hypothetical protein